MAIYNNFTNQHEWKEYLQHLVKTNDVALKRAILIIYDFQTMEEKTKRKSIEENNMGFGKIDARQMSKIAKKLLRKEELNDTELIIARNKMPKYWRQLMIVSKNNISKNKRQDFKCLAKENEDSTQMMMNI